MLRQISFPVATWAVDISKGKTHLCFPKLPSLQPLLTVYPDIHTSTHHHCDGRHSVKSLRAVDTSDIRAAHAASLILKAPNQVPGSGTVPGSTAQLQQMALILAHRAASYQPVSTGLPARCKLDGFSLRLPGLAIPNKQVLESNGFPLKSCLGSLFFGSPPNVTHTRTHRSHACRSRMPSLNSPLWSSFPSCASPSSLTPHPLSSRLRWDLLLRVPGGRSEGDWWGSARWCAPTRVPPQACAPSVGLCTRLAETQVGQVWVGGRHAEHHTEPHPMRGWCRCDHRLEGHLPESLWLLPGLGPRPE